VEEEEEEEVKEKEEVDDILTNSRTLKSTTGTKYAVPTLLAGDHCCS
jgi:hypothetical protein